MSDELLYRAVINCPHQINAGRVVLMFDPQQPGHNVLNQLHRRLQSAASPQSPHAQGQRPSDVHDFGDALDGNAPHNIRPRIQNHLDEQSETLASLASNELPRPTELCDAFAEAHTTSRQRFELELRTLLGWDDPDFKADGLRYKDSYTQCAWNAWALSERRHNIVIDQHLFEPQDLIGRALRNISASTHGQQQRWASVKNAFGVGSTVARGLCKHFGLPPDEVLKKPKLR